LDDIWVTFFWGALEFAGETKPNQTEPNRTKNEILRDLAVRGSATECNKVQQSATEMRICGVLHWGEHRKGFPWTSVDFRGRLWTKNEIFIVLQPRWTSTDGHGRGGGAEDRIRGWFGLWRRIGGQGGAVGRPLSLYRRGLGEKVSKFLIFLEKLCGEPRSTGVTGSG
jgi:hypothetical protein